MGMLRAARIAGALFLLAFAGSGCAARWAYHQGQSAAEKGNWDLAVARLTRALDKDPRNISYKIALETARVQASRYHYEQAKKSVAANDLAKAVDELQIASNYDPSNRAASDDLTIARKKLQKQQAEQQERDHFDQMKARAKAARSSVPVLSPRETAPISMRFEDTSLQKIFETLGKLAGVNVLFDDSFRDKKTSVVLTGLSFQEALERLTMVNRLFYKVLDQNTLIVAAESRQNRQKYDDILLRTFYLQNAEVNETANLIKTLAKLTTVGSNLNLGAITVLGTIDQIAIAERIIEANDKPRGEVVVEVQILEIARKAARDWGLRLSSYTASATLNPISSETNGSLTIRPYLLSSLNQADWIVNIPNQLLTDFLQSGSTTRILAAPRLRAAEGKKTQMSVGTEVPVPVTSIGGFGGANTGQAGFGSFYPQTSFQYRNVGVTMELTPRVSASGDITLELNAEFSLLGGTDNLGSAQNPLNIPRFLTRKVNGILRLRDGETGLIGGLLQQNEAKNFTSVLGMDEVPIIGKLLGQRHKELEDSEILISITPHIVRGPRLTDDDFIPLRVGTQEVPRVEGARPGLFGPEETTTPAAARPTQTPGGSPGVAPVAVPVPIVPSGTSPQSATPSSPPAPSAIAPTAPSAAPTPTPAQPGAVPEPSPTPEPDTLAPPGTAAPMTPSPITIPPIAYPPPASPGASAAPVGAGGYAAPSTTVTGTTTTGTTTTTSTAVTAPGTTGATGTSMVAPSAAPTPTPAPVGGPIASLMLSPPEVSLRAGQSAGFSIVLVGGRDIVSVELSLVYDPSLAEVTDVAPGSLLTLDGNPVQTSRALESGRVRVRFARTTPVTGSGGVAAITLRGLRPGSGALAIESMTVGHTNGADSPALPSPGRLVVAP